MKGGHGRSRCSESHGVKVFVDPKVCLTSRWHRARLRREGLNEGFKFYNPNVKTNVDLWRKLPYLKRLAPATRKTAHRSPMQNHFELFPVHYEVNRDAGLRHREIQSRVHPDKFVQKRAM